MGRWLEVLSAFLRQDQWGVRELAQATELPRSAVHRILHEMRRLGLLSVTSDGQFTVGPVLARLAIVLSRRLDIVRLARPVLEETMRSTGETVILGLFDPTQRQVWAVDGVESAHPVRYIWDSVPGGRELHLGATGKGILAFLPAAEREEIIEALEPEVLADPSGRARLDAQLRQARKAGWVISRGETYHGAVAVASPVRDATGTLVADIVISWPQSRSDARREIEMGGACFNAATRLSRALGYEGDIRGADAEPHLVKA